MRLVVCWLIALALMSCSEDPPPNDPQVTSFVSRKDIPMSINRQIDVLFVVDNSPAMAPHREAVLAASRDIVATLAGLQGGLPDIHLGFVTTDVGSRGAEDSTATTHGDCSPNGDAGELRAPTGVELFLEDILQRDGTRLRNYDGELADVVEAAIDQLGTSGCSFPRPLEAVRRSLRNPVNDGFVRDDAFLAIVFLTPNDDCSFRHETFLDGADAFSCVENPADLVGVAEIAAFVKEMKPDPAQVVVGGAFGPAEPFVADTDARTVAPSCTVEDPARSAQPGVRLQAFLDEFPNRSSSASICANPGGAIDIVTQLIKTSLGSPCFEGRLLDVEPDVEGQQLDCASWFLYDDGEEVVVPPCTDASATTCWRIEPDPISCLGEAQLVKFEQFFPTSESLHAIIECVVEGG
jgi:hypothetical protein